MSNKKIHSAVCGTCVVGVWIMLAVIAGFVAWVTLYG
jgi:hypothetical protein